MSMEKLGGGGGGYTRFRHQRSPPSSDRFIGIFQPPQSSPPTPPIELSEDDIFSTPSGSSSASPTHPYLNPNPSPSRIIQNHNRNNHNGILAALNENLKSRSGSDTRPVFNHKASTSASLSSSSSTSPTMSTSSRMMIPRRPPIERARFHPQSAPVNIPVMTAAMRRRVRELEDAMAEEEEEEDEKSSVILPPHEVVAARESPLLACSVLEGAGRTLKGRDLRQVRNAIWRRTGFID